MNLNFNSSAPRTAMKKLPPFGKFLHLLQSKGVRLSKIIYVWVGTRAWQKANEWKETAPGCSLVLPAWLPPSDYSWPVKQCNIAIWDTGFADSDYIAELVNCLYQDGAAKVLFINPDGQLFTYYKDVTL